MKINYDKAISSKMKVTGLIILVFIGVVLAIVRMNSVISLPGPNANSEAYLLTQTLSPVTIADFPPSLVLQNQYPVNIQIDQVNSYTDRYFVKGTVTQLEGAKEILSSVDVDQMYLFDKIGRQIEIEPINFAISPSPMGSQFSFYTTKKGNPGEWTLVIPSMDFSIQDPGYSFSVDFGTNPKAGDEIKISKRFMISGHQIFVDSLKLLNWNDNVRIQFSVKGDEDLRNLSILEVNSELRTSTSFSTKTQNNFLIDLDYYAGSYKPGIQKFEIKNLTFSQFGNWQLNMTPDKIAHPGSLYTSELNNACFSGSLLNDLLNQAPEPFLKNSSGLLLVHDYSISHKKTSILLLPELEVQKEFELDEPESSELSPDGKYLVYYQPDDNSIIVDQWKSGNRTKIPLNTYVYPDGIIFSDDSSSISFALPKKIYTFDIQDLQKESEIPQFYIPIRWLEKNKTLLVMQYVPKSEGGYLFAVDAITSETKPLLLSEKILGFVQVSPDKKQIAYSDSIADTDTLGIFVSAIDGTNRHLIIVRNGYFDPASISWSTDGKWLLISLYGPDRSIKNVLIDPVTCETHSLDIGDVVIGQWVN